MAQFLIFKALTYAQVEVTDPTPGSVVEIFYDNAALPFEVVKVNGVTTVIPFNLGKHGNGVIQPGTHWTLVSGSTSSIREKFTSSYSYCSGTTLLYFEILKLFPEFPFINRRSIVDSPVCGAGGGPVCDMEFNAPLQITNSTDLTSNNGQVIASAASSNGTVKYGLTDFNYTSEGQFSGTFTGLSPGFYTIYAKDENDCTAQLDFRILFQPAYTEHYRFQWGNIHKGRTNNRQSRLRIYEREYFGDLVEVATGGESPFILNKPKQSGLNDKFYPIHTTNALLTLESEVDYQYLPLFTQDSKKFKCVYEVDEGAGFVEVWQGFNAPSVYREMFVPTPYVVEFQLTDNVVTLKEEPFTDDNGNILNGRLRLIEVIAHIMRKTGLLLNIRSGINIFDAGHDDDPEDDPLDQTYIDVACYREDGEPFNCWRVLECILKPFGARIYQCDNLWIIEEIDRAITTYAFRLFDYNGEYISNSTFDPIMDIKSPEFTDRVALLDNNQSFEVIPAYGKIEIVSQLNYIGSIVAGSFEKNDLLSPEAEELDTSQGVFTSEEGFKDWTLRLNGTTGVSFGRVVIGFNKASLLQGNIGIVQGIRGKQGESVGAFYFNSEAWSGNLRDAYIESSAKSYQYGPGDEIKFSFDFSTTASTQFEFMVLRFSIKIGSNYLQENLTWDTAEHIYRSYPKNSNSLQRFEISAPVPETDVVVNSTARVRIYFYSGSFFDYGLPSLTDNPGDGTEGINDFKNLATVPIDYDYRVDVRNEYDSNTKARRLFYELRVDSTISENLPDTVRPNDFNVTTNKKTWHLLKSVISNGSITRNAGLYSKFYIDNVALDALINGQAPPTEQTISLPISRYVNEYLTVDLYNFDVPDITNAKNMYNNYFRLSGSAGAPTTLWTRFGITEQLPLQQILLKVLGANHSAPTFRLTGSFLNEYSRISINNYLRLTKPGSSLSVANTEFTSNLNSWSQTGSGEAFVWAADNSGSATVTLSGVEDSQKIYQAITHNGGYINITVNVRIEPLATNNREDVMWVLFWNGDSIIHMEKLKTFAAPTSDTDFNFTYTAFAPGQVTRIGFYFKNVNGTDSCRYEVGQFKPEGADIQEIYQISDYSFNERMNSYELELMQISKTYISLQGGDQGGDNQSGEEEGEAFDGAYSSAYGGGFDTVLN